MTHCGVALADVHTLYTAFRILLQGAAVCCSVLQCVAVCCSVLQCVAVCCSVLQCADVHTLYTAFRILFRCVASRRCVRATRLNATRVLLHTEVHCDSTVHAAHVMTMRQHRACNACALDVTHSSFIHACMNESIHCCMRASACMSLERCGETFRFRHALLIRR